MSDELNDEAKDRYRALIEQQNALIAQMAATLNRLEASIEAGARKGIAKGKRK